MIFIRVRLSGCRFSWTCSLFKAAGRVEVSWTCLVFKAAGRVEVSGTCSLFKATGREDSSAFVDISSAIKCKFFGHSITITLILLI